jgi:hypothetical protein
MTVKANIEHKLETPVNYRFRAWINFSNNKTNIRIIGLSIQIMRIVFNKMVSV